MPLRIPSKNGKLLGGTIGHVERTINFTNTLLSDEEISMLVILCMNESFMMHMHQYYKAEIKKLGLETFGHGVAVDNPDGPLVLE
jgi:short subunit fatty acids transporter